MQIAQRHLPFSLKWIKIIVSVVSLIIGLSILYLFIGEGPVQEIILYSSAIPIIVMVVYLLARTKAPIELKNEYLEEIEMLKREKAELAKKIESRLKIYCQHPVENPHFLSTKKQAIDEDENGHYVGLCTITNKVTIKIKNMSSVEIAEGVELYCTELRRIPYPNKNKAFPVYWTQGVLKRDIEPGNHLYVGIVEFERHTDETHPDYDYERFNITIPQNTLAANDKGSDFLMAIRIVSRKGPAQNIRLRFGVNAEGFYIKTLEGM